ncbi:MAG: CvpA family protein [Minisyncoccota bacterium]
MSMEYLNVVDIIILVSLLVYILVHIRDGALVLIQNLSAFVGSVVIAFITYKYLSDLFMKYTEISLGLSDALSFLILFLGLQILIHKLLGLIFSRSSFEFEHSTLSRVLAILPATIDGLILVSLTLLLLVVAPVLPQVKAPIEDSRVGSMLVDQASGVEVYIDKVFGRAAQESLGFLTVKPEEGEVVELAYKPKTLTVDTEAEAEMLVLINAERAKVGAKPLVVDESIVPVARAHSIDMWERQYFAHESPDGKLPFDRMREAGVSFLSAGENLALARTVERAHDGLMNSEGHKRNILDPTFGRIGIGVIDGGIYGKMFTQNFAN